MATSASNHGQLARQIWRQAQAIARTSEKAYLRQRAIKAPPPVSLRFVTQCLNGPTKQRLPAMLSAVLIDGRQVGLHLTYPAGLEARLLDVQAEPETYSAFAELRGRKDPVAFANAVKTTRASASGVTRSAFVALRLDNRDAAVGMIQASMSRLIEEAG